MDHIPKKVFGSRRIYMLDGFSSYNQILVQHDDQEKKTFFTPWETFVYAKIPLALMNVGVTFHRAMDISFVDEKDKFIVSYLDDITIFLKSDFDHL